MERSGHSAATKRTKSVESMPIKIGFGVFGEFTGDGLNWALGVRRSGSPDCIGRGLSKR